MPFYLKQPAIWIVAASLVLSAPLVDAAEKTYPMPENERAPHRTYLQNYKDMMLAGCIAKAYAAYPEVERDADASASAYNEFGSFDAEHDLEDRQTLPDRYLGQIYGGFEDPHQKNPPPRLDFMKCMDMYHSHALDAVAHKYVFKPARTAVQDNPGWIK